MVATFTFICPCSEIFSYVAMCVYIVHKMVVTVILIFFSILGQNTTLFIAILGASCSLKLHISYMTKYIVNYQDYLAIYVR